MEGLGDNAGAFFGPLIAAFLIVFLQINIRNIRYIFYLSLIPGLIAILMINRVKEKSSIISPKSKIDINLKHFPIMYWKYLLVTILFGIGNSSNSFIILHAKNLGIPLLITIVIYAFYNLVAALISYPSGSLSDKLGRKPLLLAAFLIFFISYLGFALVTNVYIVTFIFISYGLYQGIFRAVGKSFAIDFVPAELRASGVGWYSTAVGLSALAASIIAGQLWDKINHSSVFLFGAIFSLFGIISLLIFIPNKKYYK